MSSKKQNSNNLPLIATIVVALISIALAVTAMIMLNKPQTQGQTGSETPNPGAVIDTSYLTPEYREECEYAAHDLLDESHEILRLFVTEGLFHEDEPYGNLPEDGYYTVNSTDYTSLEQIEELVRSVYADDAAEQILKNSDGKGLVVYANREQLVRVEESEPAEETGEQTEEQTSEDTGTKYEKVYKLGISSDFTPDKSKSWSSCAITIDYLEEGRCGLTVYLDGVDSSNGITDENRGSVLEMTMIKLDEGWRLAEFVTRTSAAQ